MRFGCNIKSIPTIINLVSPSYNIIKYTTEATLTLIQNVVVLAGMSLKNL